MTVATQYVEFAKVAHGVSPTYENLAITVSEHADLLALLDGLPENKRNASLLFGVVRFLGGPVHDPVLFCEYAVEHWPSIDQEMRERNTQTNEIGRCAALLPALSMLPQPIALLEIGTSAGLCLYPDQYAYKYDEFEIGKGQPVLECAVDGTLPPIELPRIAWRAGIDPNPLDVTDPGDFAWLDSLIWPEQTHRRERLRGAAAVAAADPPHLVRGDLVDDLPALAAQAPPDATLVVFHTSVMYQVPEPRREAFAEVVRELSAHWLANEEPETLPLNDLPKPTDDALRNLLILDEHPLAWTRLHGQAIRWFG